MRGLVDLFSYHQTTCTSQMELRYGHEVDYLPIIGKLLNSLAYVHDVYNHQLLSVLTVATRIFDLGSHSSWRYSLDHGLSLAFAISGA